MSAWSQIFLLVRVLIGSLYRFLILELGVQTPNDLITGRGEIGCACAPNNTGLFVLSRIILILNSPYP